MTREILVAAFPATPRHTNQSLPLLPSGPGGVYDLSLRGDQKDHHNRIDTGSIQLGCLTGRDYVRSWS